MRKVENVLGENGSTDQKNDSRLNPFSNWNHFEPRMVFWFQSKPKMVYYEDNKPLKGSVSVLEPERVLGDTNFVYSAVAVSFDFEYKWKKNWDPSEPQVQF